MSLLSQTAVSVCNRLTTVLLKTHHILVTCPHGHLGWYRTLAEQCHRERGNADIRSEHWIKKPLLVSSEGWWRDSFIHSLRSLTVLWNSCINPQTHQQCARVTPLLHTLLTLALPVPTWMAPLDREKWQSGTCLRSDLNPVVCSPTELNFPEKFGWRPSQMWALSIVSPSL